MLLNKANDEKMLRHIFIDLDNYKYHARPCIYEFYGNSDLNNSLCKVSAISRNEIINSKHLTTESKEEFYVVFNEKGYGFFIDKIQITKELMEKKLGDTTIKSTIEELEINLFAEMINICLEKLETKEPLLCIEEFYKWFKSPLRKDNHEN
ncbi:hypothetical protein CRU92_00705 [Arcobacter sp. FW59]|nr:hypothetical protein CRU92_00705 [Arcobacter sp. FW59]